MIMQSNKNDSEDSRISCRGYCARCNAEHLLVAGVARDHCLELMNILERKKRIDLAVPDNDADPRFSTDYVFGEARGQMFGVMVCRDRNGKEVVLRAFSGQYNGAWEIPGWVGPLFDVCKWEGAVIDVDSEIKKIGAHINQLDADASKKQKLIRERKVLSQNLMKNIHSLYELTNFRSEKKSLFDVLRGEKGIPNGTGDCCAPKLLNYAAINGLIPLGLAEFYWGRENRSESRKHGLFYPSCVEKCRPILGFLLCGFEQKMVDVV